MTNPNEHTLNTPPDTFLADIAAAKEGIAEAEQVLRETDHTEELTARFEEELLSHVETLRAIFSRKVAENTPLPEPPIPGEVLTLVIERLMEEGVFGTDAYSHAIFLTRLLVQASEIEGIHDFHLKVPKAYTCIGAYLPAPLSLTVEGGCEEATGFNMKGGTLTVEGNCGKETGDNMEGGTLIINGDVAGWATGDASPFHPDNHGKIIHKGLVLWDNGPTPDTPQQ